MPKVTIQFEDVEGTLEGDEGTVDVQIKFDPDLITDGETVTTPAQNLALTLMAQLNQIGLARAEEAAEPLIETPGLVLPKDY